MKEIPLRSLKVYPANEKPSYPPYEMLLCLNDLFIFIETDIPGEIKALQTLDSPLQKMAIDFYADLILNDTTLESFAKWNASLQVLELVSDFSEIFIKNSPFKWFPNLLSLRIEGSGFTSFNEDSFYGLN